MTSCFFVYRLGNDYPCCIMKILYDKLTKEESALICERMSLVAQTKPRIAEILQLTVDPKNDPVAQKVFGLLLEGRVMVVDNLRRRISESLISEASGLQLVPEETFDLEIEWFDRRDHSVTSKLPFSQFQEKLPDLDYHEISIWHHGLSDWVPLCRIKEMVLGTS